MFKKPKKIPQKTSARSNNDSSDDDGDPTAKEIANLGKQRFRKRSIQGSEGEDSEDENPNLARRRGVENSSHLLEQARQERQKSTMPKKSKFMISSSSKNPTERQIGQKYQSVDTSQIITQKDLATRVAEYHPQEKQQSLEIKAAASMSATENTGVKIYTGNQEQRNKFLAGPLRAQTFVRTTCRFDYQPDICKDYKETGFCGFGDTCIYLHDRGDTKTGWQLEAEWEEKRKREQEAKEKDMERFLTRFKETQDPDTEEVAFGSALEAESSFTDDGLPFACFICRSAFDNPVVTSCGHYFCQTCILNKVKESSTACPICSKDTSGIFNHPSKLFAKKRRLVGSDGTWEKFEKESKRKREGL